MTLHFLKHGVAGAGPSPSFAAAAEGQAGVASGQPFSLVYAVTLDQLAAEPDLSSWFNVHCGLSNDPDNNGISDEVADNAKFRRIDNDWLLSVEQLALAMNNDTNNASLVLAFELGKGGKVLLFAGDAQRGNWASWADHPFKDGNDKVDVRELLGRTVFYKAGHHGSHNATLAGKPSDAHPNLS